jgi:hypothetical protein
MKFSALPLLGLLVLGGCTWYFAGLIDQHHWNTHLSNSFAPPVRGAFFRQRC